MKNSNIKIVTLFILVIFLSCCQENSEKERNKIVSTPVILKTYVIKSDAEAKHFIEPHIIRFRKTNPDFKVNIEYINRSKNIKGADIITLAFPYPENFPFELFDTIAQLTDTIVFVTSRNNVTPLQLAIKRNIGKHFIQLPKQSKMPFYTATENSPDFALLFDTLNKKRVLANTIKTSNDFNKLTEWVASEKNAITWVPLLHYLQKKNELSIVPVIIKNKPYTITRSVLVLAEKNKTEEDSLFVEFKKTLHD